MTQDLQRKLIEAAPVLGLMLLAGAFRLPALGSAPPGLYHDEAFYGLDAQSVLAGNWQIYFPANNGREPLFVYLAALSIRLFGSTPFAVRLPAAIVGMLTVPATYWMTRRLWDRRTGLLAAALMAVTLWPVHLGRIGFRVGTLPLVAALGIGSTAGAWRSGSRRDWVLTGAVWGLSFYTYLAARFSPIAFALVVGFLLLFRQVAAGPFLAQRLSNGAVWATVGLALVAAPLAIYAAGNWDVVMGRPGGISILEPGINKGDLAGTLAANALKAIGMFFWQGDRIPRHNAPGRPVFDPLIAVAFVVGLIILLRQARRRVAAVFVLAWIGVMLLPTILSEDTPHFLRAAGTLPAVMIVPALGLDWLARWIERHADPQTRNSISDRRRMGPQAFAIVVIAVSALWTLSDYAPYAVSADTGYAFEAGAVALADEVNRLSAGGYRIVMDERYSREWAAIPFMLHRPPDVQIAEAASLSDQPSSPAVLVTWPYADWTSRLQAWPAPVQLHVSAGPTVKGDRDPQPYPMAAVVRIEPIAGSGDAAEATFDGGLRLVGHAIEDRGQQWLLRTLWQIERPAAGDVTLFVHLLNGGALALNADGDVGDGMYPMRLWRPGDVVVDERIVPLPAGSDRAQLSLEIGLYFRADSVRVKVTQSGTPVSNDALQLGAPGGPGP